jgi:hypothetical protein
LKDYTKVQQYIRPTVDRKTKQITGFSVAQVLRHKDDVSQAPWVRPPADGRDIELFCKSTEPAGGLMAPSKEDAPAAPKKEEAPPPKKAGETPPKKEEAPPKKEEAPPPRKVGETPPAPAKNPAEIEQRAKTAFKESRCYGCHDAETSQGKSFTIKKDGSVALGVSARLKRQLTKQDIGTLINGNLVETVEGKEVTILAMDNPKDESDRLSPAERVAIETWAKQK